MDRVNETVISREQIATRVRELAAQITADYQGKELFLLAVLRGAIIFMADLARNIQLDCAVDFMVVEKMAQQKDSGHAEVKIIKDTDTPLAGRHVLLVEDVIDEGRTLSALLELLALRNPASLKVVTIFEKAHAQGASIQADYVGFTIPNRFVVGYGLDHKQRWRNLPYLGTLERTPEGAGSASSSGQ
jgi:hypoxanthine phosphoribosyltransferase